MACWVFYLNDQDSMQSNMYSIEMCVYNTHFYRVLYMYSIEMCVYKWLSLIRLLAGGKFELLLNNVEMITYY